MKESGLRKSEIWVWEMPLFHWVNLTDDFPWNWSKQIKTQERTNTIDQRKKYDFLVIWEFSELIIENIADSVTQKLHLRPPLGCEKSYNFLVYFNGF